MAVENLQQPVVIRLSELPEAQRRGIAKNCLGFAAADSKAFHLDLYQNVHDCINKIVKRLYLNFAHIHFERPFGAVQQ